MSSSHSKSGTRKTTPFIDNDSAKYLPREPTGQTKRGNRKEDTDAAHKFSYGMYNTIATHTGGRPLSDERKEELHRDLNHSNNLRIKTSHGNRVLDERRDARIAHAFVNDEAIRGKSTATRAYIAYQSASSFTTLDAVAEQLGNMRIYNEDTGRTHKLKNHHNFL